MNLEETLLRKGAMEVRDYQVNIADSVLRKGNSLAIMPTALGKTFVGAPSASRTDRGQHPDLWRLTAGDEAVALEWVDLTVGRDHASALQRFFRARARRGAA